jgi:hypothetical protein
MAVADTCAGRGSPADWGDDGVRRMREPLVDIVATVAALAALGTVAGRLWSLVAPRAPYVGTPEGPRLADPVTQALIAADGWFVVITGGAGLLCGITAFVLARRVGVLCGLCAGGLLAAAIAQWSGTDLRAWAPVGGAAADAVPSLAGLAVTAQGALLAWALAAVAGFGVLETIAGAMPYLPRHGFGRRGAMGRATAAGHPGRWPAPRHGPPKAPVRLTRVVRRSAHRRGDLGL